MYLNFNHMIYTKILSELVSYGFSATLIYVRIAFAGHESHSVLVFTGKIYLSLSTRELRTEPSGMSKERRKIFRDMTDGMVFWVKRIDYMAYKIPDTMTK